MENTQTNTLPPVMPDAPLSFNDWNKQFRVSSKYKEKQAPPHRNAFDMNVFKKNTLKKLLES